MGLEPKPSEQDDKDAERRFQETLGRVVNTPHKPHKEEPKRDGKSDGR